MKSFAYQTPCGLAGVVEARTRSEARAEIKKEIRSARRASIHVAAGEVADKVSRVPIGTVIKEFQVARPKAAPKEPRFSILDLFRRRTA